MTTLEEAKAFLKKNSADGTNLYDHLSEVLLKILVERPANVSDTFEQISTTIKQERYLNTSSSDQTKAEDTPAKKDAKLKQEKWCNLALDLLKINNETGATAPEGVADVLDEANMLEWAGVGFSRSETFRLSLSLQRLAQTAQTTSLRLWGKILGIGADYYVAEGELPTPYEPEDPNAEEGASGANKFTYWAMKDNGSYEWVQLPPVRRDQILIARQLKRFVRSNLNAKVLTQPPFPGEERHFLRAQIARISSSTVVCPAGYFQVGEDGGDIIPAEEPEIKNAQQLADLGSWVHFTKELNAAYGRMTPMPPKTNDDGEELPWEGEEFADPLRSLVDDKPNTWRIERLPATLMPAVGEFAVLKNLTWPGAVSIGVGKKFLNIYVGHGVKHSPTTYQIEHPKPLQVGYGVALSDETSGEEGAKPSWRFTNLDEQKDVLEDPSPPQEEEA